MVQTVWFLFIERCIALPQGFQIRNIGTDIRIRKQIAVSGDDYVAGVSQIVFQAVNMRVRFVGSMQEGIGRSALSPATRTRSRTVVQGDGIRRMPR